jgi:SAM-dependent methyltransferase
MQVRDACRHCGSGDLEMFLDFENYPLSDNFLQPAALGDEFLARFQAHWCRNCQLVQNLTDIDWGAYYASYDYTSSSSQFSRDFMSSVANHMVQQYKIPPGSTIVDIGSGDGQQLASFREFGMNVIGFEPSEVLADVAARINVPTIVGLFDDQAAGRLPATYQPVHVFISSYTFDHLPDPTNSLQTIRQLIHPTEGVVMIEVHDLAKIIERREACLFCHEHTIYVTWQMMARMFRDAGLKLVAVNPLPEQVCRGNSLIVVGVADTNPYYAEVQGEPPAWDGDFYRSFAAEVKSAHRTLRDFVKSKIASGVRLGGYGASARSISTMSLAGLDKTDFKYVIDANRSLSHWLLPKSHVPIRPPQHVYAEPVDEIVVFNYGYLREIAQSHGRFLASGGRFHSLLDLLKAG